MLFAYFDESGKPDSSNFVCIAGYTSDDDGWKKFCEAEVAEQASYLGAFLP